LHVQVAFPEPLRVGGTVIVHQIEALGLGVLLYADDVIAVESVLRIPAPVARSGVHGPVRADGRAGAAPHAAAGGSPIPDLVGGQIVGIGHVRIPTAALRAVSIYNVLPKAHRVRLAVGRHELRGRGEIFAVGGVQLVQPAIPGSGIDSVPA